MKKITLIRVNYVLIFITLFLVFFMALQVHYDISPQKGMYYLNKKHIKPILGKNEVEVVDSLHPENYGIIEGLKTTTPKYGWDSNKDLVTFKNELRLKIIETLGVHVDELNEKPSKIDSDVNGQKGDIKYQKMYLKGYDGLEIPVMQFFPVNFDKNNLYPTIIVFSGTGRYNQVNFEKGSYQHAAALELAQAGYLVFSMENRGMGELEYLGGYLRIDAVARLIGGSYLGEIVTDGLSLLEYVSSLKYVDKDRIGTAGVSLGGALSLFTASLDERIKAVYDQGYFGSYKTTFGTRANHGIQTNIPGILKIADLNDIAGLIAPRSLLIVNGDLDSFFSSDAKEEFVKLNEIYREYGVENNVDFKEPKGVRHEFSTDIAITFFNEVFG